MSPAQPPAGPTRDNPPCPSTHAFQPAAPPTTTTCFEAFPTPAAAPAHATTQPTVAFQSANYSVFEGNTSATPLNLIIRLSAPVVSAPRGRGGARERGAEPGGGGGCGGAARGSARARPKRQDPSNTHAPRTAPPAGRQASNVTVTYATASGTATAGTDFVPISGTVNFAPREVYKAVTLNILGDTTVETDESLTVTLTGVTGGGGVKLGSPAAAVVTIKNDDSSLGVVSGRHDWRAAQAAELSPPIATGRLRLPVPC